MRLHRLSVVPGQPECSGADLFGHEWRLCVLRVFSVFASESVAEPLRSVLGAVRVTCRHRRVDA